MTRKRSLRQAGNGRRSFGKLGFRLRATLLGSIQDTVLQMIIQEGKAHTLQRRLQSTDLSEDVDAILLLLHHPLQTTDLALNTLQTRQITLLILQIAMVRVAIVFSH